MFPAFKALSLGGKVLVILAAIAVVCSIFGAGYFKGAATADIKIAKYEQVIAQKNAQLDKKQTEIIVRRVVEYKDRVQVVEKNTVINRDVLKDNVVSLGQLSKGLVYLHDQAAEGLPADPELAADPTPDVVDKQAFQTIVDNYQVCKTNEARLQLWIDWYNDTYASWVKINKGN